MNILTALKAGVAFSALTATAAQAQEAPRTPPADVASDNSTSEMPDIVVTANKREETLSRVPIAVSVISNKDIESKSVVNLGQIQGLVPSFTFLQLQDPSVVYLSVRGINSVRNSENPVAFVVDGVQTNDPSQINQQLSDIERIEILKGPQGSLYGRNAVGGAINVVTKTPTNDFSGQLRVAYQNGNERDLSGSVSGPIVNDKILFRIGGSYREYDGILTNDYLNVKVDFFHDYQLFGKLYFRPTDNLNIELRASTFYGHYGSYYNINYGIGNINQDDGRHSNDDPIGLSEIRDNEFSAKIDFDLGFAKLTSVTAYSRNSSVLDGDAGHSPAQDAQIGVSFKNRAINEDIRLTSKGDGPLQWVVGAYALHKKQLACTPVYLGPAAVPGSVLPRYANVQLDGLCDDYNHPGTFLLNLKRFNFISDALAGYGQATYRFSPKFEITAGLRYDYQRNTAYNLGTLVNGGSLGSSVQLSPAADIDATRVVTAQALQPKLTLTWKPNSNQMLYATFSKGFRAGGFNNTIDPNFLVYKPERVTNFEAGAKSTWLNGMVRTEFAGFYEIETNRPDFVYFVANGTQNIFTLDLVHIYGIEGTIMARPARGLTITASGTLMDSNIVRADTTLVNAQFPYGKHPSYIYHTQASVSATYETNIGSDTVATLGIDYSLKARNWFWYTNTGYQQKAINLVNARLSFQRKAVDVKFFVDNLFNLQYSTEFDPYYSLGFGVDYGYPAPPRRYGVAMTWKF